MGRLLRGVFKLAVIAAVIGGVAVVAKKLMGGLGPTPGSADAPREWPSLVPEPAPETVTASNNGAEPAVEPAAGDPPVTEADPTT